MKNNKAGFSLIELLIVVVIIGIIAAIAIPGYMASRKRANEGSMVSCLRTLHGAQVTYASSYGKGEYAGDVGPGTLTALSYLASTKLIDDTVGSGSKSGYSFVGGREQSSSTASAQFFISAIPIASDPTTGTGNHRFGVSTDGVIRADLTLAVHYASADETVTAPPLAN